MRPALSEPKARAVASLPYFPATRLLLQTKTRFWHAEGLSGTSRSDQPAETWDAAYDQPADRGLLAVTVGGAIGRELAGLASRTRRHARPRARDRDVSADARPRSTRGVVCGMGGRAVVARGVRGVPSRTDVFHRRRHRAAGRAHTLCWRAHVAVDGVDGGGARVGGAGRERGVVGVGELTRRIRRRENRAWVCESVPASVSEPARTERGERGPASECVGGTAGAKPPGPRMEGALESAERVANEVLSEV